jgi:hypothetical protein
MGQLRAALLQGHMITAIREALTKEKAAAGVVLFTLPGVSMQELMCPV